MNNTIDFSKEKYEYMLHTWGGFYNEEYKSIHNEKEGYFFFESIADRNAFKNKLSDIRDKFKTYPVVFSEEEGKHVRYKTIAVMKMVYRCFR